MSDRDISIARAAIEAAAKTLEIFIDARCVSFAKQRASAIRALDHAAIVAGVPERTCLNCGRHEPCELSQMATTPAPHNTPETWPGSPCTFDPTPRELWDDNKRLRSRVAELERQLQRYEQEDGIKAAANATLLAEVERLTARVAELEGQRDAALRDGKE